LRRAPLRLGVFGAEPWSDAIRQDLEERLGIVAVDLYGLSEVLGPGVACECHAARHGLHGWEDHFLFETIVADGDRGGMAKKVSGHIKTLIGVTCNVVIKLPGEVPRSQGKAVRVKDERKR
jgi:phenylacetate-coenzyme A ligase PaaK-like adenylate-forming protein